MAGIICNKLINIIRKLWIISFLKNFFKKVIRIESKAFLSDQSMIATTCLYNRKVTNAKKLFSSYINVIELSYSIWDSIPVTYDPITRFLLGDFPVIKTGFLALAGSTQISRMGSSPNLQRGCEPPEIR